MATGIGAGFARLWTASTAGNLGDGVGRIAIALLAAELTRDPLAVAAVTALSFLPWLVFGLPAGALVDRLDRRRLAVVAGAVRVGVVTVLLVAAMTGHASLWLLYAMVVALYACETVYDNAVISMVPMVVADRDNLELANGRLQGARLMAENFVGPPLAGMLFALTAAYAFGVPAACYALAVLLLVTMRGSYRAAPSSGDAQPQPARSLLRGILRDIAEGLRYLRSHPLHRVLLGLMVAVFFGAAMVNAVMVLWTLEDLRSGNVTDRSAGAATAAKRGGGGGAGRCRPGGAGRRSVSCGQTTRRRAQLMRGCGHGRGDLGSGA